MSITTHLILNEMVKKWLRFSFKVAVTQTFKRITLNQKPPFYRH